MFGYSKYVHIFTMYPHSKLHWRMNNSEHVTWPAGPHPVGRMRWCDTFALWPIAPWDFFGEPGGSCQHMPATYILPEFHGPNTPAHTHICNYLYIYIYTHTYDIVFFFNFHTLIGEKLPLETRSRPTPSQALAACVGWHHLDGPQPCNLSVRTLVPR